MRTMSMASTAMASGLAGNALAIFPRSTWNAIVRLLALLAVAACATPAEDPLEAAVGSGFRGAVLVAKDGRTLLRKGYGVADESTGAPNLPATRFRIGSITKQFVAAGILILRDRGSLALSDSVCAHVTPCPATWQPVTLRHLLTHSSGVATTRAMAAL